MGKPNLLRKIRQQNYSNTSNYIFRDDAGSNDHITVPSSGTLHIRFRTTTGGVLSLFENPGASEDRYDLSSNGSSTLTANIGYSWSLPVIGGEIFNFKFSVTSNTLSISLFFEEA